VLLEDNSKPDPQNGKWLGRATYGTKGGEGKVQEKKDPFPVRNA